MTKMASGERELYPEGLTQLIKSSNFIMFENYIFYPGMVPLDPERDFHKNGCIFMPVASIWACFEQKRILRNLVYVSWSVHQITYFLEIVDLVSKKKFKPQEMIEMDHIEGGLNFFLTPDPLFPGNM